MSKFNVQARHRARALALQALYQFQFNHNSAQAIEAQFIADDNAKYADIEYFKNLLHGVLQNLAEIDDVIRPVLDRELNKLTPVELAVLRLAVYEFKYNLDVPYRVVINEALELTKRFGTQDGYKYVNGVLDRLAKELRAVEMNS